VTVRAKPRSRAPDRPGPRDDHSPRITIVAALARNRIIGRGGALPWHIPDDLRRFRQLTLGHPVIMGRRTYESIGRPLPGRDNIVVSRSGRFAAPGCRVAHGLEDAIAAAAPAARVFVIGGAEIYALALPAADRLELTEIDAEFEGDALFPEYDRAGWLETSRESHAGSGGGRPGYDFVTYDRRVRRPAG